MNKIVITGATGFLGKELAKKLSREGNFKILALGRNRTKGEFLNTLPNTKFIEIDLLDKAYLETILEGAIYVFHCAAKSSPWGKYKDFYNSNVIGTQNIINACKKNKVKKLIYVSTPSIYFEFKDKLNIQETEKYSQKNVNNYVTTKIIAEKLVLESSKELPSIIIRPRAIFGTGDQTLIPRLLKANNKILPKVTKADIQIDITHVYNVVEALILAMNAPEKYNGECYNITNGEPIYFYHTLENLITKLGYKYNYKIISYKLMFCIASILELIYKFIPNKEPIFTRYTIALCRFNCTLDISKAQKELGYKPVISVEQGLNELIKEYREDK